MCFLRNAVILRQLGNNSITNVIKSSTRTTLVRQKAGLLIGTIFFLRKCNYARKKPARTAQAAVFPLVPSPLVEKRSDPYHGSVLPLNYEGGNARMKLATNLIGKGDYIKIGRALQPQNAGNASFG